MAWAHFCWLRSDAPKYPAWDDTFVVMLFVAFRKSLSVAILRPDRRLKHFNDYSWQFLKCFALSFKILKCLTCKETFWKCSAQTLCCIPSDYSSDFCYCAQASSLTLWLIGQPADTLLILFKHFHFCIQIGTATVHRIPLHFRPLADYLSWLFPLFVALFLSISS